MKCFHFLLVSRSCIFVYTLTWCKHNHTLLVLVSFLVKESNNLTFMVTFVEPPLGARIVNDTQSFCDSTQELNHFVVMCRGFLLLYHEHLESIKKGQKFLGHFVHLFWICFFLCFRRLVHFLTLQGLLAPFFLFSIDS